MSVRLSFPSHISSSSLFKRFSLPYALTCSVDCNCGPCSFIMSSVLHESEFEID
jgi:hypothetical protein